MSISNIRPPGESFPPVRNQPTDAEPARQTSTQQSRGDYTRLIESLRNNPAFNNRELSFETGTDGEPVIIVSDKDTGKVVREIPPAELRELAAKLEQLRGIFLNQTG